MSNEEEPSSNIGAKRTLSESTVDPTRMEGPITHDGTALDATDTTKRVRRSRWQTPASASMATITTTQAESQPTTSMPIPIATTTSTTVPSSTPHLPAAPAVSSALAEMQAKLAKAKELAMAKLAKVTSTTAATQPALTPKPAQAEETAAAAAAPADHTVPSPNQPATAASSAESKERTQLSVAERLKLQIEREKESRARFVDPSIKMPAPERKRRELVFLEPGTFQRRAEAMRAQQLMREARARRYVREVSAREAALGVDFKLLAGATSTTTGACEDIEWWDRPVLGVKPDTDAKSSYDAFIISASEDTQEPKLAQSVRYTIDESKITSLIHHPRMLLPAIIEPPAQPPAVMLTKAEAKKKRKRERAERIKEQHAWIRARLIPPPPPKLRLSTLMHTMGDALISDPTGVVAQAKAQMEERIRKHEEANRARALTPEQRREKRYRKRTEDTSYRVCVAVYRVGDLSEYIRRERIQRQAKRYQLTGVAVLHPDCNLIVLEGGPKGLSKVHKYLTRSIRWTQKSGRAGDGDTSDSDEEDEDEDEDEDSEDMPRQRGGVAGSRGLMESQLGKTTHKTCELIWTGELAKRNFDNFVFETGTTYHSARQIVERHGVPHYWDAGLTYSIPRVL